MNRRDYPDLDPEILGMQWTAGDLVLVGSTSWGGRSQYLLGNCIIKGTGDDIHVAYFQTGGDATAVSRRLLRMQAGTKASEDEKVSINDIKDLPVYIDDTPHPTIDYIVSRIFHLVGQKSVLMVIIDHLQDIDGSVFNEDNREHEMNSVLRILKALAESLSIIIVVASDLSSHVSKEHRQPTLRDILDVSEAEEHCDQIILLHPVSLLSRNFKIILPLGYRCNDRQHGEQVINAVLDDEHDYFKKATAPFKEETDTASDSPMLEWYPGEAEGEWLFEFLDSDGMGWTLILDPRSEEDSDYYQISVQSWAGEETVFPRYDGINDIDHLKAIALEIAREHFPEVEIPEKK
jgi:hypothetical protein